MNHRTESLGPVESSESSATDTHIVDGDEYF